MQKYRIRAVILPAVCALLCGCGGGTSAGTPAQTAPAATQATSASTSASAQSTSASESTTQTELTTASALTDATTGQPAETTKDKRQAELDKSYRSGYDKGYADGLADGEQKAAAELKGDTLKVWVSGDFTATVRHLTEDFVSTPDINTAVVTLFQDGPFVLQLTAELCKQIQAGKTYTFTVDGAEAEIPAGMVWDENYVSPEALMLRKFRVTGVREPKDDEYGLECWRVKYTKQ